MTTIQKREALLTAAANAYHNNRPPIMSDGEYDAMISEHRADRAADPDNPVWEGTILDAVGAPVSGDKIRHLERMMSLDNVFTDEGDEHSSAGLTGWLNGLPAGTRVIAEPKIDGLSASITYIDGRLARAATRGDGEVGEDITAHVMAGCLVPDRLDSDLDTYGTVIEIRGEICMPFAHFVRLNSRLEEAGEPAMANPRNAAAGIIGMKTPDPDRLELLQFVAHGFGRLDGVVGLASYGSAAAWFNRALGYAIWFPPSRDATGGVGREWIADALRDMRALDYPIDGIVFKVDDFQTRRDLGATSRAPRWAVALKLAQPKVTTRLTGITVQVGRSGVLTPVAELEPVWVDGSTVGRATLHNEARVRELNLLPGDTVELRKAGAIIPEILRSVSAEEMPPEDLVRRAKFDLIAHVCGRCPACGSDELVRSVVGEGVAIVCQSPLCVGRLSSFIRHFCGKTALDLEGVGVDMADALAERLAGAVMWPSGSYDMGVAGDSPLARCILMLERDEQWWQGIEFGTQASGAAIRFGKRAKGVMESIRRAAKLPLKRWLVALGLPSVGVNTSAELTRLFKTSSDIMQSCQVGVLRKIAEGGSKADDAIAAHGLSHHLGPVSCKALVEFWTSPAGEAMNKYLTMKNIQSDNHAPSGPAQGLPLSGKTVVVTGTLSVTRDEFHELLRSAGAVIGSGISAKTSYLVAGDKAGSKLTKAAKLGVRVLDESQARALIAGEGGAR